MMKEQEGIKYTDISGSIVITGFEEIEEEMHLPDEIEGKPVTEIGEYAFSQSVVEALWLPRYLRKMGRYLFYRCFQLRKLVLSDCLTDIGAGAFTGCSLAEVEIDFYTGEQSCLKFILDEIRYRIQVTLRYHRADGSLDTAKLIFPEHYEEAVENTPARIVETHYHGSGGDYRQCFYNKRLDYKEYDRLFKRAVSQEQEGTVTELAVYRLRYPYRLSDEAKEQYETYVSEHMMTAGSRFAAREDTDMLHFFSKMRYWTQDALNYAIETSAKENKTAIVSMLIDEKHTCFPKKKKVFEL